MNKLHLVDADHLGWWLSERQLHSGGLNGRPEKLPDLCYSWWCLSSMKMINRMHLIDHERLIDFILACQDDDGGGFSDRPENWVDPYHTMLGIASISLIGLVSTKLKPVNPVLCMPEERLVSIKFNT